MAVSICIIGNSHAACLRTAWRTYEYRPDSTLLDFFAAPGASLAALELKGGFVGTADDSVRERLRNTSGGRDSFRPTDYDAFLLIGLRVMVPRVVQAVSSAVARQCSEDSIADSLALPLGLMIRSQTGAPIYVGHTPLLAAAEAVPERRSYDELYEQMKSKFDRHDMRLLRQPAETILLPCNSSLRFSLGSTGALSSQLAEEALKAPASDLVHMNAAYGQLFLRDFFKRLDADQSMDTYKRRQLPDLAHK